MWPTTSTRSLRRLWTSYRYIQLQERDRSREHIVNINPAPSSWLSGSPADIMYSRRRLAVILADTEGRRRLNQSRLEQVVICGRITCERSFCPLIERRWRVRIRNGYWSMVALSASTLMTRQCNLTWSRRVQRCWWVFRVLYSHLYSLYHRNFVILHQRHSTSCLLLLCGWQKGKKMD